MIHLHRAHGCLLCAFLSPRTNLPTATSTAARSRTARFALDVRVVGPDFPIGYRLSADEYVEGTLAGEKSRPLRSLLALPAWTR